MYQFETDPLANLVGSPETEIAAKAEARQACDDALAAFLATGGEVTVLATDATGIDWATGRYAASGRMMGTTINVAREALNRV